MGHMNISLTGETFTDYLLDSVGSDPFQLEHDWFTRQDLIIRTAAAGGGTLLVEDTDYTLGTEDTGLSTRVTAAVGSGRNVFYTITIINADYQACALYFSGKYIADSVDGEDDDELIEVDEADYILANGHSRICIEMTTGASERDVTLGPVAYNLGREVDVWKVDSGAGEVKLVANGSEKFLYNGAQYTNIYVSLQDQHVRLRATAAGWRIVCGVVQPVAGESSLGTDHYHPYQYSAPLYSNTSPTANVFYTVTIAGLPKGTKAIEINGYIDTGAAGQSVYWRPYGCTDTAAQSSHRLLALQPIASGYGRLSGKVTVDDSGRFDICATDANINMHITGYMFYGI